MKFIAVVVLSILSLSMSFASDELVIHTTPVNPAHSELHAFLIKAYENLDVEVAFTSLPYTRGLVSANYGVIDAVDLRFENHAENYANLVRVEFPVHMASTYLVVNNAMCDKCSPDQISSVASISGYHFTKYFADEVLLKLESQEFAEHNMLFRFFDRKRVDAMVVGDIFLPEKYNSDKYTLYKLGSHKVFHYLHNKHEGLAKRLERSFRRIKQQIAGKDLIHTLEDESSATGVSVSVAPSASSN